MTINIQTLSNIGWEPFFWQQLNSDDYETILPFRVIAVHRGVLLISDGKDEISLSIIGKMIDEDTRSHATIGDWLLLNKKDKSFLRILNRRSLFSRKAPGSSKSEQLIAANVNTVFIVSSCNQDFSLSRIERYLALAYEAGVEPIIILTKTDLCDDVDHYLNQIRSLNNMIIVEAVNALDTESISSLQNWLKKGQTIALLGSSGVGKTTIVNGLSNKTLKTGDIREDDAKGRHTTTHRSLIPLDNGALLLDSPGMRELQLFDTETGVSHVFSDVEELAQNCRFNNCTHDTEPSCAVQEAIKNEKLALRRLESYRKLMAEQKRNSASIAERRKKDKDFGKLIKSVKKHSLKKI